MGDISMLQNWLKTLEIPCPKRLMPRNRPTDSAEEAKNSTTRYEAKQRHVAADFRRGIHDLLAARSEILSLIAGR